MRVLITGASVVGASPLELPPRLVRGAAWASWKLRLQPTSPGWLDMGIGSPTMQTTRAREQLGWQASRSATQALGELLEGLHEGAGLQTPPLDPASSGPLRARELGTGVGGVDRLS